MKKIKIEVERDNHHIMGYVSFPKIYEDYDQKILDFIMNWQNKKGNKKYKIYKHLIRYEEENISNTDFYTPQSVDSLLSFNSTLKIPYCDRVTYVYIYYQ
jgi:hypothetical protein